MRGFDRQAEPEFWGAYERQWLYETTGPTVDPLAWKRDKRTLANHFHDHVRAKGEPRRCAYCDGPLGVESRATIDHHIPQKACRALVMTWDNLYPACDGCNSGHKGVQWSCRLVRPDVDPVDEWFDFHEETGRLAPAPELDLKTRARVRLTIRVLGLNAGERPTMRRTLMRNLHNAWCARDYELIDEMARHGVYRFVARKFLVSKKRLPLLM